MKRERGTAAPRRLFSARTGIVSLLACACLLAVTGSVAIAKTPKSKTPTRAQLRAAAATLVADARKVGTLNIYTSADPVTAQALADKFGKTYGIKVTFTRLTSGPAAARYTAEAQSGNFAADVVMIADPVFFAKGLQSGWFVPANATNIPNVAVLPKKFRFYGSVGVGISRVDGFVPNTKIVSKSDIPKTWTDLTSPRWKGKLIAPDPRPVPVNMGLYQLLRLKYGDNFLRSLGQQSLRPVPSMVTGVQLVAAGERDAAFGVNEGHMKPLLDSAPDAPVELDHLQGINFGFVWNAGASKSSPNPAGARLFLNWLVSPAGQIAFNSAQRTNGVLPNVKIPGIPPLGDNFITLTTNVSQANQQKILSLLGLS
jgi:iron(III) transport system substrate-binding protein